MNNVSKYFGLLFLVLCYLGSAQSDNQLIKKDFTAYLQAITNQQYDKAMNYMVEEVFAIVPRDQMVAMMGSVMNTEEMDFKFGDFKIKNLQKPIVIADKQFVILNYLSDMSIRFNSIDDEDEPSVEDVKMQNILISAAFEVQFGKGNVILNEDTGYFDIKALKKAVAIKKQDALSWKFIVVEKGQPFLLKQILPAEILEKVLTED